MDFLKDMKAKLEELEREAQRAMQEQQQRQQAVNQAKKQKQRPKQQPQPRPEQDSYPRGGGKQDPQHRRSRKPVGSDSCPVEEEMHHAERSHDSSSGTWILDGLEGRLDEAFLLQEVLGQPRCVRGWDD